MILRDLIKELMDAPMDSEVRVISPEDIEETLATRHELDSRYLFDEVAYDISHVEFGFPNEGRTSIVLTRRIE